MPDGCCGSWKLIREKAGVNGHGEVVRRGVG